MNQQELKNTLKEIENLGKSTMNTIDSVEKMIKGLYGNLGKEEAEKFAKIMNEVQFSEKVNEFKKSIKDNSNFLNNI